MERVQVIKLYNGDQIICYAEEEKEQIIVRKPLQFYLKIDRSGSHNISMDFWLPYPVTKTNIASIKKDQIIAVLDPSDDFEEYYENALEALDSSKEEAESLGINPSAAITCVKPSGTVSQLTGVSSGMHAWHSPYYIRTVRGDKKDPLSTFLKEVGIPAEDDFMKPNDTYVFSFPVKAPEGAIVRDDLTAIDHLNTWLVYQREWCEHKPSITVSVKEHEWMEVGAWVYKHFDEVSGKIGRAHV